MPKLFAVTEIKFVKPWLDERGRETWKDPRGYDHKVVTELLSVEAYADALEREAVKAEDHLKLCAELGHTADPGGCGGEAIDGEMRCARRFRILSECTRSAERTMLVRITIPTELV